jgi:GntR family transcriptional regulator/MocR family aminotransferase
MGVARFIDEGHLAAHVRRMRQRYRERREALIQALRELTPMLTPLPSSYGMHVSAVASAGIDTAKISVALARGHVRLHSLDRYYLGPVDRAGFVFGFGATAPAEIRTGCAALALAFRGQQAVAPGS